MTNKITGHAKRLPPEMSRAWVLVFATLALTLTARPLAAQDPAPDFRPPIPTGTVPRDSLPSQGTSPGGAFLRSMVLPGWGQAANGSYSRATFYLVTETAAGLMIFKTHRFLNSAKDILAVREAEARSRIDQPLIHPDTLAALVDNDPAVADARSLVESRSQQREDWLAVGIFFLLLNGADAFVSAHLRDFPDPLTVETAFVPGGDPAAEVMVKVRWPWGRDRARAAAEIRAAR